MLTDFDKDRIQKILDNDYSKFDYFTAHLLRLIAKADIDNRKLLRKGYPEEVIFIENYCNLTSTEKEGL